MSWHPVAAMICRWYVMHILLRVILSPPTNDLQLLMSFPGRRLLRKRCARSMFALFQQTSYLTFGDCRCQEKFPWCKTSSNLLVNMVGKLTMSDALVLLQSFLKQTVTLQRFGLEQEYTLLQKDVKWPLGRPVGDYPWPQVKLLFGVPWDMHFCIYMSLLLCVCACIWNTHLRHQHLNWFSLPELSAATGACVALKFVFRWISAKQNSTLLEEVHLKEEANRDLGRVVSLQSMQKRADCETGSWKIQRSFSLWRLTHCWNLELRNRKLKLHHQQRMHNQALSQRFCSVFIVVCFGWGLLSRWK